MRLGSGTSRRDPVAADDRDGAAVHRLDATDHGAASADGPVVVVPDPTPARWYTAWRRSGRAEGRATEFHPVRLVAMVGAATALGWWLPGAAVFLGVLLVIIVIHEMGHYAVARRCGMRPTEFFVGFGPTVWARPGPLGLRYGLKAFPLGGYVKIPGMGPREELEGSLEPYSYRAATRPRRMAVILAGSAANLVLAVVLFWCFAMTSPAVDPTPVKALTGSVSLTGQVAVDTVTGIGRLVGGAGEYARSVSDGEAPENRMVSAIGGAQLTDGLLEQHWSRLLLLAGLFSASIGVLNLLPLLPLDGGHAAIIVIESAMARIRRRPRYRVDPETFKPVALVVVVALLLVGASSMYVDLIHPLSSGG
jgi:membrane-associated protease RseP (regulator of RpoE activity)